MTADDGECKPLVEWIDSGKGRVVFGGLLTAELAKNRKFFDWLSTRFDAGLAVRISDQEIDKEISALPKGTSIRSNDKHILALASASGARLLFSKDGKLIDDFKSVVRKPKGKIYSGRRNKDLLKKKICRHCV